MLPLVVGTSKKCMTYFMSPLGHHFFLRVFTFRLLLKLTTVTKYATLKSMAIPIS